MYELYNSSDRINWYYTILAEYFVHKCIIMYDYFRQVSVVAFVPRQNQFWMGTLIKLLLFSNICDAIRKVAGE